MQKLGRPELAGESRARIVTIHLRQGFEKSLAVIHGIISAEEGASIARRSLYPHAVERRYPSWSDAKAHWRRRWQILGSLRELSERTSFA
jgi:hypothetical protein